MRQRGAAVHRLIKRFPTASLLAAAVLSYPVDARAASPEEATKTAAEPVEAVDDAGEAAEAVEAEAAAAEEAQAEEPLTEADRMLQQILKDNPDLDPAILEQIKSQLEGISRPVPFGGDGDIEDAEEERVPGSIEEEAPPDEETLLAAEQRRQEAEALIAQLADATEEDIATIERSLAELGEASLVPLKLAALSDDFDIRTRAGAMARRLRWRLVCHDVLLDRHPGLPGVMAGEETKPRRELIDAVLESPHHDDVPLFVECLADRDQYIRERGIDGLVLIGKVHRHAGAGRALQQAALHSDDKSVVLLSVAGLGEIEQADIAVLTELFEKTEHAEVQRTILMTAGYTGNGQAIGLIERALKDPRWRLRAAGLEALEDIHRYAESADLGSIVLPLLTDPEPFIRANALRLVAELKMPGAASTVWKLIEDGSIDRAIGIETLALLQDARAYDIIARSYETATTDGDHEEAIRWLTYLNDYEQNADVDQRLITILQDKTLRPQWEAAVYLASRRSNNKKLVPIVAPLLLDEDAAIRAGVWEGFGRYRMDGYTLPTELEEGLANGDTEQRLWRIKLIYQKIDLASSTALYDVLDDNDSTVVNLALSMIGHLLIQDSLGEDDLPYRSSSTEYIFDEYGNHVPKPITRPELSEAATKQIQAVLQNADLMARCRAATLLYATDQDRSTQVTKVLNDAIRSQDTGRIACGLFAASYELGELVNGVDLIAIADNHPGDPYLLANACSVMLQVDEKELVDKALDISEGFELYRNQDYFIGLTKSGSKPAIDLVKRKVLEESDYYGRRMVELMVPVSPDAAIEIGGALLDSPKLDAYDRQDIISNLVRTKKNEKLIPLLKKQVEAALASSDPYERRYAQQYQQMLLSIDPASVEQEIIGALNNGSADEQQQAINTVTQMAQPNEQIVEMVLKVVLDRKDAVEPSWSVLVGWLAQQGQQPALEQAIDQLPGVIQSALLAEMSKTIGADDIDRLLTIQATSSDARNRITKMLALLLTKHPQARPTSLASFSPTARVYLLPALGHWPEGVEQLQGWLDHEGRATADAALRGLALARIQEPPQALAEAEAARFAEGVTSEDPTTAYLCAEALYQRDPERLRAIDPAGVSSRLALLRIGTTGGTHDKGPVSDAIQSALSLAQTSPQSSASRLALIAAINSKQQRLQRTWQRGHLQHAHQDLLLRVLEAYPSSDMLYQVVYAGLLSADDPSAREVFDKTFDAKTSAPSMALGLFFDRGFIESAPLDQLQRYLKSTTQWAMQGQLMMRPDKFVGRFDAEPAVVKAELLKLMKEEPSLSLSAALLLYELDRDEAALTHLRDTIANLPMSQLERRGTTQEHDKAIAALVHAGNEQDIQALLGFLDKLSKQDNWHARSLAMELLDTLIASDPQAVRAYYEANKTRPEDELYIFHEGQYFSPLDMLNAIAIDDPADREKPMLGPDHAMYARALRQIKDTNQPGGKMASPPWEAYGNLQNFDVISRADFIKLDLELTLGWIKNGKLDQSRSNLYNQAAYYYQRNVWWVDQPVFDQRMISAGRQNYNTTALFLNPINQVDPPTYYASLDYMSSAVVFSDLYDDGLQQLSPLLESEDTEVAMRAARVAAGWRAVSVRDALMSMIARPDDAGREAAWVCARLFGPEARQAILDRAKASEDFDERVELACLLTLLGDNAWARRTLDRAQTLLATQQLLGRTINPVQQFHDPRQQYGGLDIYSNEWGHHRRHGGHGGVQMNESIIDGRMTASSPAWEGLLAAVVGKPDEASLPIRLDLSPLLAIAQQTNPLQKNHATEQALTLRHDLSLGLTFANASVNNLPLPELVGSAAPPLMSLEAQESALFMASLTQLAKAGQTPQDLESAWRAWLSEHGQDSPDALWSAGVTDAIGMLTDERWWRRSLAHERLQRLTGQAIEQPVLFDLEQWASLQGQWQSWAASEQGLSARLALSAVAVEAGLVDAAPKDEAEELAMLVRMAGWGDDVQSTAALHRLELWPDAEALINAAASWQASPRGALRAWYLHRASDAPRIFVPANPTVQTP